MAAKSDYYNTLGVPRNATEEEVRKAFRRKALEFHPDRNKDPNASEKFQEVSEAYQVLTDPQRRSQYDRFGHAGVGAQAGQGFEGVDTFGGFGDIFEAFFGGGGGGTRTRTQPRQGADLLAELELTFEEAVFGASKEVAVARSERCQRCQGVGSEPGTKPETCANCKGTGRVRRSHRSIFGQFVQEAACDVCNGVGERITHPCRQCRGIGRERAQRQLSVDVPAGVEDRLQVSLRGEGEAGEHGGPPGDLLILLRVQPHPQFRRSGHDVLYDLKLIFPQLALGDEVAVPTLDGDASLRIPPGTQANTVFRLKGHGIPHLENKKRRGDELVTVRVTTPTRLNQRQRELLEELRGTLSPDGREPNARPDARGTAQPAGE